jgi:hypothetical protein
MDKIIIVAIVCVIVLGCIYCLILRIQKDEELRKRREEFLEGRIKKPHPYDYIKLESIEPGWEYGDTIEHKEEVRS